MATELKFVESIISIRWLNHFLFWFVLTLSTAYHGSLFGGTFVQNLANMVSLLPIHIVTAYLVVYQIMPYFLFRKKWFLFLIILVFTSYVAAVVSRLLIVYVAEPIVRGDVDSETLSQIMSDPLYLLQVYVPSLLLPTILLFLIKMTKERFSHRNRENILIKEKQASEINFLKAQMNPHLLFNTLNNIYSLAQSGSKDTSEMILKLSEIMDYTLYECNEDRVLVTKEWELIENYVDLETLRFSGRVDLYLSENIDNSQAVVAPLLLIPLVENAFKYSLRQGNEYTPMIKINLEVANGVLDLKAWNTMIGSKQNTQNRKNGIGIENLRKQLSLQYFNKHELKIEETADEFFVHLNIEL